MDREQSESEKDRDERKCDEVRAETRKIGEKKELGEKIGERAFEGQRMERRSRITFGDDVLNRREEWREIDET